MSVAVRFRGGGLGGCSTTLSELRSIIEVGPGVFYKLTNETDQGMHVYEFFDGSQRYVFVPDPLPKHAPCTSLKPTHDIEGHTMLLRVLWYLGWISAPPVALFGAANTALGGFTWDASQFWGGVLTLIFGIAGTAGMFLWLDGPGRPEISPRLPKDEVRKDRELRRQLEVDAMRERGEIVREARRKTLEAQNRSLEAKLGFPSVDDQPQAIEPSAIHDPRPDPHYDRF